MKGKTMKTSAPPFMKGGKGKMAGKGAARPAQAGTTSPGTGGGGGKFPMGGKAKMAGKGSSKTAKAGSTVSN